MPQNALAVLKELDVFEECCEHGFQTKWLKTFDAGESAVSSQ